MSESNYRLTQTGVETQRILNSVQNFDDEPLASSQNPVKSSGIKAAIDEVSGQWQGSVAAEAAAREAADTTLQENITAEIVRATAKEGELQQAIAALSGTEPIVGPLPESGEVGRIYRVPGTDSYSDYQWYNNAWKLLATYSLVGVNAQVGYYTCSTAAGTVGKVVAAESYTLQVGGAVLVKFNNANTSNGNITLKIGDAASKPLYYHGSKASAANSWEAGEVVRVYYDGTNYYANPVEHKLADNLRSWADRTSINIEDTWSDQVRTTAGDNSINSELGARLLAINPTSDFSATSLKVTGFNLLRNAVAVGDAYYFLVPKLTFGTFGTADENNGVLFTNSAGTNLTPTVRFKALADGVPGSASDGSACPYTNSNGYRFFTTSGAGYLIVSGITLSSTCAHIAWSRRYDEYVSITDVNDAGSTISLTSLFDAVHSDVDKLLTVGVGGSMVADSVAFGTSAATWTRRVARTQPTWTQVTQDPDTGLYEYRATISGIASDGQAAFESETENIIVAGTELTYYSESATATTDFVKYELATVATGNVSMSNSLSIEDWGLEMLIGASGTANITTSYSQSYPDALAAIAQFRMADAEAAIEGNSGRLDTVEAVAAGEASSADFYEMPKLMGQPMKLFSNGAPSAAVVPDNWIQFLDGGYDWNGTPSALGQELIDYSVASGGHYTAVRDGQFGLKWVNS